LKDGRKGLKIGLLEMHQELLEIEQMTDFIVMKYRNELDAFITSAKAEVLK
jgi:hypothetical protein